MANPWTLPYWVDPCWMPGVGLLVNIPAVSGDYLSNDEHLIAIQDNYDEWIERIREDYWLGGWWESVNLPYQPHPEGGLLVIQYLALDENITFACPWRHVSKKTDGSSPECWERFMPPVPLNSHRHPWDKRVDQGDGFYPPYVLVYASDFEKEDD
ncbi:hypothetical protein [Nostoc sp.]|uniref:hypothetical protein n=1 Tax=Nostoc sp. TaxID=1180 RepID=UPI002FF53DA7